jgi:hypothetical protein
MHITCRISVDPVAMIREEMRHSWIPAPIKCSVVH